MTYREVVKLAQTEIADRQKYCNNKIRYVSCSTWEAGDQINLWTYWQGYQLEDIDEKGVDILLVGQDWGSPSKNLEIMDNIKRIQSGDPEASYLPDKLTRTDQNLVELFEELGCHIMDKNPGKRLFFTNYSLGYRGDGSQTGGMTKGLLRQDKTYFIKLVEVLKPKIIICLGKMVYEVVTDKTVKDFSKQLSKGIPFSDRFQLSEKGPSIPVYGVAHCGYWGMHNAEGKQESRKTWRYIANDIALSTV